MSAMDELVTWLRAQLDEEAETAQVANALTRPPWTGGDANVVDGDGYPVVRDDDTRPERAVLEHIARWDPARVLAEVDAKRRILDLHAIVDGYCSVCSHTEMVEHWDGENETYGEERISQGWPCLTVRLLALPYASRDGYREEWRP
jgi:hypothetical protein